MHTCFANAQAGMPYLVEDGLLLPLGLAPLHREALKGGDDEVRVPGCVHCCELSSVCCLVQDAHPESPFSCVHLDLQQDSQSSDCLPVMADPVQSRGSRVEQEGHHRKSPAPASGLSALLAPPAASLERGIRSTAPTLALHAGREQFRTSHAPSLCPQTCAPTNAEESRPSVQ